MAMIVVFSEYGDPEVLRLVEVDDPGPDRAVTLVDWAAEDASGYAGSARTAPLLDWAR